MKSNVSPEAAKAIRTHLEQLAANDKLFAVSFSKPHKNLEDCLTYIMNTAKKEGVTFCTDSEVYAKAVHYYEEDDINVGDPINCRMTVNHANKRTTKGNNDNTRVKQLSLFDL